MDVSVEDIAPVASKDGQPDPDSGPQTLDRPTIQEQEMQMDDREDDADGDAVEKEEEMDDQVADAAERVGGGLPVPTYEDIPLPAEVPLDSYGGISTHVKEDKLMYWAPRAQWIPANMSEVSIRIDPLTRSILVRAGGDLGSCQGLGAELSAQDAAESGPPPKTIADFRWPPRSGSIPVFVWPKDERPRPIGYHMPELKGKNYQFVLDFLQQDGLDLGEGWMLWNPSRSNWQRGDQTSPIHVRCRKTLLLRHADNERALYAGDFIHRLEVYGHVVTGDSELTALSVGDSADEEEGARKVRKQASNDTKYGDGERL
ncbi:uncharacterized protein BXZ73DRAFT_99802 [Epithele typhae]|uniref:uncharacterized protein n=1 Tax=Epithele typhae TaxID=378194 RepID=UPI002008320F|nr:uncharacterized protein BXZ73DRAFT_99802 [Epithele typhae]KAH9939131.1 hypothetical protein BXZ73DRAFT_99802 [Epithele typhae]